MTDRSRAVNSAHGRLAAVSRLVAPLTTCMSAAASCLPQTELTASFPHCRTAGAAAWC